MKKLFVLPVLVMLWSAMAPAKPVQLDPSIIPDSLRQRADSLINKLQIDTLIQAIPEDTAGDTAAFDSTLIQPVSETAVTNTEIFIYVLLTAAGLGLFFYIFVISLFKTLHKKRNTRQSMLLSWNLFSLVSIIWIFIIWGLAAGFWTAATFMIVVIFLFIISLIMTIIALKSN